MFYCQSNNTSNFLKDHLGSIRMVTDQAMNIEQVNDYTPFGVSMKNSFSDTTNQKYKYNGKELTRTLGLDWYEYGARMYDPTRGQWTSVDPLAEKYYGWNYFTYCMNNPLRFIDLFGLTPGDYYDVDGTWMGTDYTSDNMAYFMDANGETSFEGHTYSELPESNSALISKASTILGESSAYKVGYDKEPSQDVHNEMFAIGNVHNNHPNAVAYGRNSAPARKMRETSAQERNNSPVIKVAIAAEINAVTGGKDYSFGATNWDGAEQAMYPASFTSGYDKKAKRELHMNTWGWDISDTHYAKWQKNVGKAFQAPQRRVATVGRNKGKIRAKSTAVYGRTIFWKVQ